MAPVVTDTPIMFNQVDTNAGIAFDGTTFTAPLQGLYLFYFAAKSNHMAIHLKVNGIIRRSADIRDSGSDNPAENMASNSIILFLNPNDQLTLYLSDWGSAGLVNTSPEPGIYTSFSGVLLYESTSSMSDTKSEDGNTEGSNKRNQEAVSQISAFSAARTTNSTSYDETEMPFDIVDTNFGDDFDGREYRPPVVGVYLFTFANRGHEVTAHLTATLHDNVRRSVIVYKTQPTDNRVSSNSVILILNDGEHVGLHKGWRGLVDNSSPSNGIFTSFNGVMLFDYYDFNMMGITKKNRAPHDQAVTSAVMFTASRTIDIDAVYEDTPIEFDMVDVNIGHAFDGLTTFVVPLEGYYLFTFSAKDRVAAVHLKVNGITRRSVITSDDEFFESMSSNSIILFLSPGDNVNVHLSPWGGSGLTNRSNEDGYFISFCGLLVFETTP